MNTPEHSPKYDITRLGSLQRGELIESLYHNTPHSLSRICLQLIELGEATGKDGEVIVDDIAAAVKFFGIKGQYNNQQAIQSLARFSKHMVSQGRVRYEFCQRFGDTNKAYFDNVLYDAYKEALSGLTTQPKYIPYSSSISDSLHTVLSEASTIQKKADNEHY